MSITTKEEVLACCLALKNTSSDQPFHDPGWTVARRRESRKIFAVIFERDGRIWVNVKVDPEWRDFWRNAFPSVVPAYHMNKEHWNSIILDGTVPDEDIRRMIGESYDLVGKKAGAEKKGQMSDFARDVYRAVAGIPRGKVATYGQLARNGFVAVDGQVEAGEQIGTVGKTGQATGWAWKRLSSGSPYSAAQRGQSGKQAMLVVARS